ncbi:MAG TPA: serine hydrolase domain-containing protein [Mycobacteriales bacterium]|nr:serine hydrolase domain-containing protein [Mycobacteriales bacterium]
MTTRLERLVREHQARWRAPSVAAAVVRDGRVLWSDAVGVVDLKGTRATTGHSYRIGSISKTFTAALVMGLRDEGKLELDAPLSSYVVELDGRSGVTVRQALSHLSGIQREPLGEVWVNGDPPDAAGLAASLADVEWVLPAGRRFHYSNLAYALLGLAAERVTRQPWAELLTTRLFGPLSMEHTTTSPGEDAATGFFVHPHTDVAVAEQPIDTRAVAPAMQMWSTVEDLARFAAALAQPDDAALATETVEEMATLAVMADPLRWSLGFGLGLMLLRRGDRLLVGHAGAMPGFLAAMFVSRPDKLGAVVFTNTGVGADTPDLAAQLIEAVLDDEPAMPPAWTPPAPPPADAAELVGSWWLEGEEFVFRWRDGRLEARRRAAPDWAEPSTFESLGDDRWRTGNAGEVGEILRVLRDPSGGVRELRWASYKVTRTPEPMLPLDDA